MVELREGWSWKLFEWSLDGVRGNVMGWSLSVVLWGGVRDTRY